MLSETQRRHIKHIDSVQGGLFNPAHTMAGEPYNHNRSEMIRLKVSPLNSPNYEIASNLTKCSLSSASIDSSYSDISLKNRVSDEKNDILKEYKCSVTFAPSNTAKRKKRVIHCEYPHCARTFHKTWNFIDHARMHLGIRPFKCNY